MASPREELLEWVRERLEEANLVQLVPTGRTMTTLRALEVLARAECPHGCDRSRFCDTQGQVLASEALAILRGEQASEREG